MHGKKECQSQTHSKHIIKVKKINLNKGIRTI